MKQLLGLLKLLVKAAIFFTLFAFALNNQQDVSVHFFFGTEWRAPLVLVLLAAFAFGLVGGIVGMIPRWWSRQRGAATHTQPSGATDASEPSPTVPPHGI